jgi:hypothetical protein
MKQPYESNSELQNWLEENWRVGSHCVQMIAQRQCETMKHINGHPSMMKPEANDQAINILMEMNKIQQQSENKLANLLSKHLETQRRIPKS